MKLVELTSYFNFSKSQLGNDPVRDRDTAGIVIIIPYGATSIQYYKCHNYILVSKFTTA